MSYSTYRYNTVGATAPTVFPDPERPMFDYDFLCNVSRAFGERNDCAVVATSVVTNEGYPKVHELYKKAGRRKRCGTQWIHTMAVMAQLGVKMHDVTQSFPGKTVRSVAPQLHKDRVYLIRTAKHVLGIIDGRVEDWTAQRGVYVLQIFDITKDYEPAPEITIRPDLTTRGRWNMGLPVSEVIRGHADKILNGRLVVAGVHRAPNTRRFWLTVRAEIMEVCEKYHGVKRTTCSVELGKWQADIGYPMQKVSQ